MALVLLMLTGTLLACKDSTKDPDTSESKSEQSQPDVSDSGSSDEPEKEIEIKDFSINGQKRDYNMLVKGGREHFMDADTVSADRIAKATYTRNSFIEDNFGVSINMTVLTGDDTSQWTTILSAASGDYEIVCPDYWWQFERLGYFVNLQEREELDFTDDWWYSGWNDIMTVGGKQYSAVGDLNLDVWENLEMMFFNTAMEDAIGADIHQLVYNKEWTIDKMMTLGKQASAGLDTESTDDDVYGVWYNYHSFSAQLFSAGLQLIDVSDNRIDVVAQSRAVNIDITDACRALKHDDATYYDKNLTGDGSIGNRLFSTGKVMFYGTALKALKTLKMEGFGVVVMPKYDKDYEHVTTGYGLASTAIPLIAEDYGFSATILNALNYYSGDVVSEYYDVVLKTKEAPDPDSSAMIDLARDSMHYDLAWVMDDGSNGLGLYAAFEESTVEKTGQVQIDTVMTSVTTKIAELIAYYER